MPEQKKKAAAPKKQAAPAAPAAAPFDYEKAEQYRKNSTYLGCGLLIMVAIFQIISVSDAPSFSVFIMSFYLVAIGVVMIQVELGKGAAPQLFFFLNFGWGKLFLNTYLVCIILAGPTSWWGWVIAIAFLVSGGLNLYIGKKFKEEETNRIRKAVEAIQNRAAQQQ